MVTQISIIPRTLVAGASDWFSDIQNRWQKTGEDPIQLHPGAEDSGAALMYATDLVIKLPNH